MIAGELNKDYSFDLGIGFSPTFAPEAGYKNTNIRLGIEYGISFYKYQDSATFKIKGVTQPPRTTFKLLRLGLGMIGNEPAFLFSPIQVYLQDKAYLAPTFGFGKNPYTVFSISYELID